MSSSGRFYGTYRKEIRNKEYELKKLMNGINSHLRTLKHEHDEIEKYALLVKNANLRYQRTQTMIEDKEERKIKLKEELELLFRKAGAEKIIETRGRRLRKRDNDG